MGKVAIWGHIITVHSNFECQCNMQQNIIYKIMEEDILMWSYR